MSSIIRICSDPHFGHENMAIHRGFSGAEEHDEHIVENWNSIIKKRDITYILGDITMEKANYEILNRLNGRKKVVLGNHDKPQHVAKMLEYVDNVAGIIKLGNKKLGNVWLTHCPVHRTELLDRCRYNIHGHVHAKSLADNRYINVCMENIGYTPKTIEELIPIRNNS